MASIGLPICCRGMRPRMSSGCHRSVGARYLRHLHNAWNAKFPHEPMARQDIVLTLPASFDEVARELTVAAAARAELPRVVLIEEPQAAFYAWVYRRRDDWHQQVAAGQTILICDIGGGTTDFTLLRVRRGNSEMDQVQFHRVAVGDHLILGGDNLDLTLARRIEERLLLGNEGGHSGGRGSCRAGTDASARSRSLALP